MKEPSLNTFRVLGLAHVIVGLFLLLLCSTFGLFLTPVLALGPLWLVILGVRLWRPSACISLVLRRTHRVSAVVAGLLCAYGILALRAAGRSAAAGGGLLGAYGLLPLGLGVLLGGTAATSLWLASRAKVA